MTSDEASGAPLVRPKQGRLKIGRWDGKNLDRVYWTAQEITVPRAWEQLSTTAPGYTLLDTITPGSCWAAAVESNDMSCCGALATGVSKTFLWHLLQPVLYFVVFLRAYPMLEALQCVLGAGVALREALYALSVRLVQPIVPADRHQRHPAVHDGGGCRSRNPRLHGALDVRDRAGEARAHPAVPWRRAGQTPAVDARAPRQRRVRPGPRRPDGSRCRAGRGQPDPSADCGLRGHDAGRAAYLGRGTRPHS